MLIYFIIGCGIIIVTLWIVRMIRVRKERLEKKKLLEQRLEHLMHTNKKKSNTSTEN
ncbi:hypothetical protein I6G82_01435 [Lysinibacillus macroides]|nr:hypothetical protein I6G82_01435 [Lysinibacillus macroides]